MGGLLALAVGIPGLAFYFFGRAIGIGVTVKPDGLDAYWWTVPVLLLAALKAALEEEVIVIGYLYERLDELGWGRWRIILSSAVLRGSYHLYQGFGAFVANAAMGVLFGWLYTKYGRLLPLIITHFLLVKDERTTLHRERRHAGSQHPNRGQTLLKAVDGNVEPA